MSDFIPYTQLPHYFASKSDSGCKIIGLSSEDHSKKLNLIKEQALIQGYRVPYFHKIYSVGVDLPEIYESPELLEQIDENCKKFACMKYQIIGKPVCDRKRYPMFDKTRFTYMLDLKLAEVFNSDDYLQFLSSKVRNQIRRGAKQCLSFQHVDLHTGMNDYVNLRQLSRLENGFPIFPRGYLEKQILSLEASAKICLVKYENEVVCGQIIQKGYNIYTLTGVCTSKIAYTKRLNANDVMQFNVVKLAIDEGVNFIDWVGAQPKSKDPKVQAIDKFKQKWGGELIELPCMIKGYT